MKKLQKDESPVYTPFKNGFHVIRRSDRFWAGLSSDLVIESVLMRSLKATGGLTRGRGMSETQRLVWLLSMPITAEVNNAMQQLTEVDYTTSEQHKDMSDSRIKRDMKDTKTVLEFMGARDPFSEDSTLRSIVTGVIADNRVNVDKAKEVGKNILKTMTHKNTEEYTFKKDTQAITMDIYMISEVIHKEIQVDPQLLFQRLITVRNYANEDVDVLFKHELCTVPASLNEPNGLPRKAYKAILAEAI